MLKTLSLLFRARAADAEEALFDANAVLLVEQRVREALAAHEAAKRELALVMAEEAGEIRALETLATRITKSEQQARQALTEGRDADAMKAAETIAALEDERAGHETTRRGLAEAARQLNASLETQRRTIRELKRGLSLVRAHAALERSQLRLSRNQFANEDAFREAKRTLERAARRQTERRDYSDALDKVEADLARRGGDPLAEPAHPRTDPQAVLERLKRSPDAGAAPKP